MAEVKSLQEPTSDDQVYRNSWATS